MKKALFFLSVFMLSIMCAQAQGVVTGQVKCFEFKDPLPGVTVLVEGTLDGTLTDFDGKYRIEIPTKGCVLVFMLEGYEITRVQALPGMNIDVALVVDDLIVIEPSSIFAENKLFSEAYLRKIESDASVFITENVPLKDVYYEKRNTSSHSSRS